MMSGPVQAHGTGRVASSGTFAVCDPDVAATTGQCYHKAGFSPASPRNVTISLSNFGANKLVHVWFLNSEVDDPNRTDCFQAVGGSARRTHLGDTTMNGSGSGSLNATLPPGLMAPPNAEPGWSYGTNWLCATTAPHTGGQGTVGDQTFMIYPV
jgi:hypothetical protein